MCAKRASSLELRLNMLGDAFEQYKVVVGMSLKNMFQDFNDFNDFNDFKNILQVASSESIWTPCWFRHSAAPPWRRNTCHWIRKTVGQARGRLFPCKSVSGGASKAEDACPASQICC